MHLSVKRYPTTACGYRIELARKDQMSEMQQFLRDNFHSEETMLKYCKSQLNPTKEELKLIEEDEDKMVAAAYENSPCLVAISNKTNEIVGVILTLLNSRNSEEQEDVGTAGQIPSEQFRSQLIAEYWDYMSKIDREVGILNKYPEAGTAMELFIIAVSKEHRKKGLAKDLSLAAIEVAKCMPSRTVVFGIYTSMYSRKVSEQIGMQHIMDIDLENSLTDTNGQPIFPDVLPNNVVPIMAMLMVPDNE